MAREEVVQRRDRHRQALLTQLAALLVQRDIRACPVVREDRILMRLDPT